MLKIYETLAEQVVTSLWENHLDLDRFLPALCKAMDENIRKTAESPEDYCDEELDYAANQAREGKLFLEALGDAISNLEAALIQTLPSDDRIIMGRVRTAAFILRNLKRRVDFV